VGEQAPVPNKRARRAQQAKEDRAAMDLPFSFPDGNCAGQAVSYCGNAALSLVATFTVFCTKCVWRGWEIPGSAESRLLLHFLQHHPRDLGFISLSPSWFPLYIALAVSYPSHEKLSGILRGFL